MNIIVVLTIMRTKTDNAYGTKLNDNEVREVARMQQLIDSYEGFIHALYMMMISKKEINYPAFTDTNFDEEMNNIWRLAREHKDVK